MRRYRVDMENTKVRETARHISTDRICLFADHFLRPSNLNVPQSHSHLKSHTIFYTHPI